MKIIKRCELSSGGCHIKLKLPLKINATYCAKANRALRLLRESRPRTCLSISAPLLKYRLMGTVLSTSTELPYSVSCFRRATGSKTISFVTCFLKTAGIFDTLRRKSSRSLPDSKIEVKVLEEWPHPMVANSKRPLPNHIAVSPILIVTPSYIYSYRS